MKVCGVHVCVEHILSGWVVVRYVLYTSIGDLFIEAGYIQ